MYFGTDSSKGACPGCGWVRRAEGRTSSEARFSAFLYRFRIAFFASRSNKPSTHLKTKIPETRQDATFDNEPEGPASVKRGAMPVLKFGLGVCRLHRMAPRMRPLPM